MGCIRLSDDFEEDEVLTTTIIVGVGILLLVLGIALTQFSIDIPSWEFEEWGSAIIVLSIPLLILGAIYFSTDSDYDEDGGVFQGFGFPLTVIALVVALIAFQTNFFGLIPPDPILLDIDGDGTGDIWSDQVPDGYVDYGSPQPYGYGNYGPEDEGLLSDGEGAAVGCVGGAGIGAGIAAWGAIPTGGLSIPFGAALGCAFGAGAGFFTSSADFDGDPTTGW